MQFGTMNEPLESLKRTFRKLHLLTQVISQTLKLVLVKQQAQSITDRNTPVMRKLGAPLVEEALEQNRIFDLLLFGRIERAERDTFCAIIVILPDHHVHLSLALHHLHFDVALQAPSLAPVEQLLSKDTLEDVVDHEALDGVFYDAFFGYEVEEVVVASADLRVEGELVLAFEDGEVIVCCPRVGERVVSFEVAAAGSHPRRLVRTKSL